MWKRVPRRLWHLGRVGVGFVFFWTGGAYLSWLHMPAVRLLERDPERAQERCRRLLEEGWHLFLGYLRATGIATFEPRHTRPPVPEGPFVLVANHPTLVDVVAVMTSIDDLYCVVKGFYYDLPLVNRLLRYCGHIDGGDGGVEASARVMDECVARLKAGGRILFFPEGTRSPPDDLHPFQRGAFEVARRAGFPVVPAVLRVSYPVLKRGVPWHRVPDRIFHYEVRTLPPVRVEGGRQASKRAAREVRRTILRWLERLEDVPFEAERGKGASGGFPLTETLPDSRS